MNYRKQYNQLIENSRQKNRQKGNGVYYEAHHWRPKSMYPQYIKCKWNIVLLTAKEHFIAIKIMEEQQEDLSQRNQEMEDIINAIPDPITIKDNSNIVFENQKMLELIDHIQEKLNLETMDQDELFRNFKNSKETLYEFVLFTDMEEEDDQTFENIKSHTTLNCV